RCSPAGAWSPCPSSSAPCAPAAPSSQSPARPSWQSPPAAPETRAPSPRLFLRLCAHFPSFDPGKKCPCQPRLAGVALSVHAAQVEELVAKSIGFAGLVRDRLQRKRQFAQPRRPRAHSSRQARSCSAKTLLSVSNCPKSISSCESIGSDLHACCFSILSKNAFASFGSPGSLGR